MSVVSITVVLKVAIPRVLLHHGEVSSPIFLSILWTLAAAEFVHHPPELVLVMMRPLTSRNLMRAEQLPQINSNVKLKMVYGRFRLQRNKGWLFTLSISLSLLLSQIQTHTHTPFQSLFQTLPLCICYVKHIQPNI